MLVTQKFNTVLEFNNWCKGAIDGQVDTAREIPGLVGKTITFTSPSGSCTFTQPATTTTGMMRFIDVKTQLEAAIAAIKVECSDKKVVFSLATPTTACTMAAANEPGRVALGLPNNEAISGVFLTAPGGTKPALVSVNVGEAGAIYITYDK